MGVCLECTGPIQIFSENFASLISLSLLTFAVGCATFGITPAARED